MRERFRQFNQKGFTLIELMATLAILALIIAIAIPAVGNILSQSEKTADDSSIELMERAGELADVAKLPHDGGEGDEHGPVINAETGEAETEAYRIPTLIKEGYLNMELDNKFNEPENYVVKVNKSGTYVYKGAGQKGGGGSGDGDGDENDESYVSLTCEEAIGQGYTCIENETEFNNMRNTPSGKYILMADIDLSGFDNWAPIGSSAAPFSGELNGNGHTVRNMSITDFAALDVGLFGVVTSGLFHQLTLEGFTMNNDIDSLEDVMAGALIGRVAADASSNPENTGVTINNINADVALGHEPTTDVHYDAELGGLIGGVQSNGDVLVTNVDIALDHKSIGGFSFGGIIGTLNINEDTESANVLFDEVSVSGVVDFEEATVSGLVGEVYMGYVVDGLFTVENIDVTADFTGENVNGISNYIEVFDYDTSYRVDTLMENINVSGAIVASETVSGLANEVYTQNVILRGIEISAPLSGEYISGLIEHFYSGNWRDPSVDTFLIEDIAVTSDMDYGDDANGVFFALYPSGTTGDIVIRDISVDSNMITRTEGVGQATGFIFQYEGEPVANALITNIDIQGALTGQDVFGFMGAVFPTYGSHYNSDGSNERFEVSNVTMNADLTGTRNVTGLLGDNDTYNVFTHTLFKDIEVSGTLSNGSGDTFGIGIIMEIVLNSDDAVFEMDNVRVTGDINSVSGDIYPFVRDWEMERKSDGAVWSYPEWDGVVNTTPMTEIPGFILHNNSIPAASQMITSGAVVAPLYNTK